MRNIEIPELIRRAGEALYGARWKADLAAELAVSDRTVRMWLAGRMHPRPEVLIALSRLVEQRQAQLGAVAEIVEAKIFTMP